MIKNKGTVIIITLLILGVLLILGSYFLTFTLTESRISKSQEVATQAYYLAEAGINEAIWKLKNEWESDFTSQDNWTASFSRVFGDGSYEVTIQKSSPGRAEIKSISTLSVSGGRTAKRVVKTMVFRALASLTQDSAVITGGASENIEIISSQVKIYNGNLSGDHNLQIIGGSTVEVYDNPDTVDNLDTPGIIENVEGQVLVNKHLKVKNSTLDVCQVKCAEDVCGACPGKTITCAEVGSGCPPVVGDIPIVDFDEGSTSFRSRAQAAQNALECQVLCNGVSCASQPNKCVYSTSEFEDLLSEIGEGGTLILNPDQKSNIIFYVTGTGGITLEGRNLTIYGILVADSNIYIGEKEKSTQLTIYQPSESPSGLLAKGKINVLYTNFGITGVIYALEAVTIGNAQGTFNISGGIIARKVNLYSIGQLNITLDNDIIRYGLGYKIDSVLREPEFSPTITIDHWEESY